MNPLVDYLPLDESRGQSERRGNVRLRFEPQQAIPINIELPTSRTVSAEVVDISLEGLGLRLSTPLDAGDLEGDWLIRFPTLEPSSQPLRFWVVYSRSDADGLWVGLSMVPSTDHSEQQKNRRLMRTAVIRMQEIRTAQWLSDQRAEATKPMPLWSQPDGDGK
jgi:PilZ domain-containing protein